MVKNIIKVLLGIILLVILLIAYLHFFGTTDLRTESVKTDPQVDKAQMLIQAMASAHKVENWDSVSTYTVRFREELFGFLGKSSNPFPETPSLFDLSYIANTYDGKLEFVEGENKGVTWGIQSWNTYTSKENGKPIFAEDANITFWIPTYQYFIEFPKRILKADALGYAGEKTIAGISCEGVLASWHTIDPQKNIDQYLI